MQNMTASIEPVSRIKGSPNQNELASIFCWLTYRSLAMQYFFLSNFIFPTCSFKDFSRLPSASYPDPWRCSTPAIPHLSTRCHWWALLLLFTSVPAFWQLLLACLLLQILFRYSSLLHQVLFFNADGKRKGCCIGEKTNTDWPCHLRVGGLMQ